MNHRLELAISIANNYLTNFASSENFWRDFELAFGRKYDRQIALDIQHDLASGTFTIPEIIIVDRQILGTANAVFATQNNTIYLSRYFLEHNDNSQIATTLIEEIGHSIDVQINTKDSAGDEGEIFSALVRGETLTPTQLSKLKIENDHALITVDGKSLSVEQQTFTSGFNKILTGTSDYDSFFINTAGAYTVDGSGAYDTLFLSNRNDLATITINYSNTANGTINGGSNNGTTFKNIEQLSISTGSGADKITLANFNGIVSVEAGDGNDQIVGSATTTSYLYGWGGNDNITGGNSNDYLYGGAGNDTINGGGGNDQIGSYSGESGADIIDGGAGEDTLSINNQTERANIIIKYTDTANGTITGGANNGTKFKNIENPYIFTGYGADDINVSAATHDSITISTGAANDKIVGSTTATSYLYGEDGNDNITGGNNRDYLSGGSGNDTLNGGAGYDRINDSFSGETGADIIDGGIGIDHLKINNYNDGANITINYTTTTNGTVAGGSNGGTTFRNIESLDIDTGSGNDHINASAANYYVAVAGGVGNDKIIGSTTATSYLYGQDGTDNVTGGNNRDYIEGGNGNDTVNGGSGNDSIYGDLYGDQGNGNDILIGGVGDDELSGGYGDDTYIIDADIDRGTDFITERDLPGSGIDTIDFRTSTTAITIDIRQTNTQFIAAGVQLRGGDINNIENVIGGAGADAIIGNSLNNRIDGSSGADTMSGGTGNDTYIVDNTGDKVIEDLSAGRDIVLSSVTYTLTPNVENLTLTGTAAINGTGNTLNNIIIGNSASNTLNGGGGNDTMIGSTGNDTYIVDSTGDNVSETSTLITEIDTVKSSITYTLGNNLENLILTGTATINGTGNALNNTLFGGVGNDTLKGGAGSDSFLFSYGVLGTTAITSRLGKDTITDFTTGQDQIVLSKYTFHAITSAVGGSIGGNFAMVNTDGDVDSSSAAIVYSQSSHSLFYNPNGVEAKFGDNGGIFASLTGISSLSTNDFKIVG